jgi:hypothetical protein
MVCVVEPSFIVLRFDIICYLILVKTNWNWGVIFITGREPFLQCLYLGDRNLHSRLYQDLVLALQEAAWVIHCLEFIITVTRSFLVVSKTTIADYGKLVRRWLGSVLTIFWH